MQDFQPRYGGPGQIDEGADAFDTEPVVVDRFADFFVVGGKPVGGGFLSGYLPYDGFQEGEVIRDREIPFSQDDPVTEDEFRKRLMQPGGKPSLISENLQIVRKRS